MSLRPHSLLCTALILVLATPPLGHHPLAQEGAQADSPSEDPAPEEPQDSDADAEQAAEDAVQLTDRLALRIGPASRYMRGSSRSDSVFFDPQTAEKLTQVNNLNLQGSWGGGLLADASYQITKRDYIFGELAVSSQGTGDFTDSRMFSSRGGPGETEYVRFGGTEHESDYLEWAIGASFRVFPTKRYKNSKMYIDAIVSLGKTEVEYTFDNGKVLNNPFDAPALNPSLGFDPRGVEPASYDMEFSHLFHGIRYGGQLTDRFSLEGEFLYSYFGRYDGNADLGVHGTALAHTPGGAGVHRRVDEPQGRGLGEITGFDLHAPSVRVEQSSSRTRGLKVGLNSYVVLTEWLTLDFGIERSILRSIGGKESRIYSDEDIADCPQSAFTDPNGVIQTLPPSCGNDRGDLVSAKLISDTVYVMGRFHLY